SLGNSWRNTGREREVSGRQAFWRERVRKDPRRVAEAETEDKKKPQKGKARHRGPRSGRTCRLSVGGRDGCPNADLLPEPDIRSEDAECRLPRTARANSRRVIHAENIHFRAVDEQWPEHFPRPPLFQSTTAFGVPHPLSVGWLRMPR